MKTFALVGLSLCGVAVFASTAEDHAFLGIFAETKVNKLVGMPVFEMPELPPGVKLPPGIQLPGMPSRTLDVRLWSPGIAPDGATADIDAPTGLKQGPKLKLDLYRPKPGEGQATGGPGNLDPDKIPSFTIKMYWGSSATIREGQPKIITWGGLTPDQKATMQRQASQARAASSSYFYKPDWTTGYWPSSKNGVEITNDATLAGKYQLNSSYVTPVGLDVPSTVNFLPPINMTSPDLSKRPDLAKSLDFAWAGLTGELGSHASVIGMIGQNTIIMWNSSEVFVERMMGDTSYMQMSDVRERVASKEFMGPDQAKMTVPAGIFKDVDIAMMQMTAWGPGAATDGPTAMRMQTKSSLSIMLGGKKMPDMKDGG
ncbi:hypothetical protein BH11ARM1_BH11ARM1_05160 [soil metagenome]